MPMAVALTEKPGIIATPGFCFVRRERVWTSFSLMSQSWR